MRTFIDFLVDFDQNDQYLISDQDTIKNMIILIRKYFTAAF